MLPFLAEMAFLYPECVSFVVVEPGEVAVCPFVVAKWIGIM
jgi:hypothetical protein